MRLLADQDLYALTLDVLRGAGHDVIRSAAVVGARASDGEVLRAAVDADRLLVTRDLDFGRLVLADPPTRTGVLLLRIRARTLDAVHAELLRVLGGHTLDDLRGSIVVVEPGRHRVRRLVARDDDGS